MKNAALGKLPDFNHQYIDVRATVEKAFPGGFGRMPYSVRILAENILRKGKEYISQQEVAAALQTLSERRHDHDFPFYPARVVMQDLLAGPVLVDLAGMRDAVAESGGDPRKVNPIVPTQLVVDHSLNVNFDGADPGAIESNMRIERWQNAERLEFFAWCKKAFANLEVIMPGNGILHQINIEKLSPVIETQNDWAFPDSLVGTDSHTPMINALGVLGWGVGGLEAESVMMGHPVMMRLPEIIKVNLGGIAGKGVMPTDIVLGLTHFLRKQNVVGAILEFHGPGIETLSLPDRATISNMSPEFGCTAALFPIDQKTLDYLEQTGRTPEQIALVREYAHVQGLWAGMFAEARYDRELEFDLNNIVPCLAGPKNPHDLIAIKDLRAKNLANDAADLAHGEQMPDGAVVIAAITSCTNTSNPRSVVAAALLAQKAAEKGLKRKPWVKTSFAPGSRVVKTYLEEAGLLAPMESLGFGIVGYACTSCNGMSGPLPKKIEAEIAARQLRTTAVLSGNRNFDGRIHPCVKEAYLASPALVVAYALAGSITVDIGTAVLGQDLSGYDVRLADIWPDDTEIDAILGEHISPEMFRSTYDRMQASDTPSDNDASEDCSPLFAWKENSTYIRKPPYWNREFAGQPELANLRPLAVLGDNVTTDDLSPSGAILVDSAAGAFLVGKGVLPESFNSYGTRRGNHEIGVRATLANPRLKNDMAGCEGSLTRLEPDGKIMRLFDAAETYMQRGQSLVIVAGKNYGAGSSRDWAAKGVKLVGVRAVIAESFERIHRSNLIGMGILPLEFLPDDNRLTLGLDGSEIFDIETPDSRLTPGAILNTVIRRANGGETRIRVRCRIETEDESNIFRAGGILPLLKEYFMEGS